MSVNFFHITWYHIHDNIHLSDYCETLKSHDKVPAFKKHKNLSLYSQNLNSGPYDVCYIQSTPLYFISEIHNNTFQIKNLMLLSVFLAKPWNSYKSGIPPCIS